MITSTPIDALDLPDSMTYQASHRTFAAPLSRHPRNFDSRAEVTAYVAWCLNSANVREITVHLYRGTGTWPVASLAINRPHNLAPWTCPEVPEWGDGRADPLVAGAVVDDAVRLIADHQRRVS